MRRPIFILFFTLFFGGLGLSQPSWAVDDSYAVKPDDGTYRIETVYSTDECARLCRADKVCRGTTVFQPDTRYPESECRLNNGFGKNTPFPILPPEPLDIDVALADFNDYRSQHGLDPVVLNPRLTRASTVHAKDLAVHGVASHTGSDGSSHSDRVQRQGYDFSIAAENVATGQKSWEDVFQAWQDSPGHNDNLLLPNVTDFGIALIFDPTTTYVTYWAMVVAAPFD